MTLKRLLPALVLVVAGPALAGAQDISPWLVGQNHWLADGDEGSRPGYLHLLWPRVAESGVRLVRIGGNGYEHSFPEPKQVRAMVDAIRGIGAEPLLQVPRGGSSAGEAGVRPHVRASLEVSHEDTESRSRRDGTPCWRRFDLSPA